MAARKSFQVMFILSRDSRRLGKGSGQHTKYATSANNKRKRYRGQGTINTRGPSGPFFIFNSIMTKLFVLPSDARYYRWYHW